MNRNPAEAQALTIQRNSPCVDPLLAGNRGVTSFHSVSNYLAECVGSSIINADVVSALLPGGKPHQVEMSLWDYKRSLPVLPETATDADRNEHKAEIADLIKDAVAFYNAYGGYLLFGVADKGSGRIIGCDTEFDVGDFNSRIESAISQSVECLFSTVDVVTSQKAQKVGVLLVPKRSEFFEPAVFKKSAPLHNSGKRAYNVNDVYVRIRDQCRPAISDAAAWKFLHSPRHLSTNVKSSVPPRPMVVSLPARDPDLVKFIGREQYLAHLRHWLADRRSPVRLLTGVGGLGKTSIAYRFCEEVVDTRAGDIERLVWLTAKAKTLSALRGEVVEVSRTDFSSSLSLYRAILKEVGSYPDWGDDEPSTSDIIEAIVEAMSIYTSLLIIDDVDSLAAEEQREVVYTLSNAISRTVSSVGQPSRILFTSRIDQGVSPANVIKVNGFDLIELELYTRQVSSTLSVVLPENLDFGRFYSATSGSPLFAASVLRLVRLGAHFDEAIDRWRGQEGVEVRRFAFEREIQELPSAAARLLYAVCLLGETSPLELSQVLEVTKTALSASISSLQSFHLVITNLRSRSESTIVAPDDVVLTKDVLQHHLGIAAASEVESACQRARSRAGSSASRVASGIGRVAALWRANKNAEALIEAEELHVAFSSHPDVTCLLATALTRAGIDRWPEADAKFALASKQLCTRPELVEGWLMAKEKIGDWQGLLSLTTKIVPMGRGGDRVLRAYVRAIEELTKIAHARHDRLRRIELADSAISYVARYRKNEKHSYAEQEWAWKKMLDFARQYLDEIISANTRPGDQIRIFDASAFLVDRNIYVSDFVLRGLLGLSNWWSDVEGRTYIDDAAKGMLRKALLRTEVIERTLAREGKLDLETQVKRTRHDLAHRAARLIG